MSEGTGPIPGSDLPGSLRPGAGPAKLQFSPAGQVLMNFRAAINVAGDDADERYKLAVTAIREKAHDVVIEIARQENHCSAKDNSTRWGLIYAASELGHPAALPFFRSVVLTPITPEEGPIRTRSLQWPRRRVFVPLQSTASRVWPRVTARRRSRRC